MLVNKKNEQKRPRNWKSVKQNKNESFGTENNFVRICWKCGEKGHKASKCNKKAESANSAQETKQQQVQEHVMFTMEEILNQEIDRVQEIEEANLVFDKFDNDIWIGDTGATSHMTFDSKGMYDLEEMSGQVIVGNGKGVKITHRGKLDVKIKQKDGSENKMTLQNVKVVPELGHNLISLTTLMMKGWTFKSESGKNKTTLGITVSNEKGDNFKLDRILQSGDAILLGAKLTHCNDEANAAMTRGFKITRRMWHDLLGHCNKEVEEATALKLGIQLTGKMDKCQNCAIEKIRKKNIPQEASDNKTEPGERIYLDILPMKTKSLGGNKYWVLIVDEATRFKKSFFVKKKSDQNEEILNWIKDIKIKYNITVKTIRCDNSGENKILRKICESEGLGIEFEYTAPGTPQQNGIVERAFPTLLGRGRAMMNVAGFTKEKREQLWCEAASTATKIDNILVHEKGEENPHKKFFKQDAKYEKYLRIFGEMVISKDPNTYKSKLEPRGRICMMLGYAENHSGEVYRLLNIETNKIVLSRDVQWLNKMWGEYMNVKRVVPLQDYQEEIEDDEEENKASEGEIEKKVKLETGRDETSENPQQLNRELRNLKWGANTEKGGNEILGRTRSETKTIRNETGNLAMESLFHELCLYSAVNTNNPDEPKTFEEAWNHPNSEEREKWREAIRKEIHDMNKRKVWKHVNKKEIPSHRRLIGCKWVFAIKRSGTYRARLVALGYSQIPGIDFTDNFAPVVNDVTFRIILIRKMIEKLNSRIIDVETAFLYGDLEEEIFMKKPEGYSECGYDIGEDECLILEKSIYGLVQAARQWWKKFIQTLKQYEFESNEIDPCMLYRKNDKGMCVLIMYVDDCLLIGNQEAINEATKQISESFNVKIENEMQDYLGCEFKMSQDGKKGWLGQPHIIRSLEKKFGHIVEKMREYGTPGTPSYSSVKPDDDIKIEEAQQSNFRSGTGTLLYLVKHSRPDIANPVRELSKVMDGASAGQLKELYRVIKYVLDTKTYGLKFLPNYEDTWKMEAYCDSDYANDKEKRVSVTGYIIYFLGVPVSWKSRGQKSVTLSSTEAEYVALSEVTKEIKFILQVLEAMKVKIQLPIQVKVDNVGAIFLANNKTSGERTKHVDVRYHFVREFIEDGIVKIIFVKSAENDADIFTKNTDGQTYDTHYKKMVWEKENVS